MQIELPIYWTKHFKTKPPKTILCGMNWYRNAHYIDQNNFKRDFSELVAKQVNSCTIAPPFLLEIGLWYKNPSSDPSNIVPLIEKVLLDALQSSNVIENDNVKHHLGTCYTVLGQDKENPRCIITIKEHK